MKLAILLATAFMGSTNDGTPAEHTIQVPVEDVINIGQFVNDGRSTTGMSLFVPTSGDANENATAILEYKFSLNVDWLQGPEMYYVKPEYPGINQRGFASGIIDIGSTFAYSFRVTITDPDGTTGFPAVQVIDPVNTIQIPPLASSQAADCTATSFATLSTCIGSIPPDMGAESDHYVIEISGTITLTDNLTVDTDGTDANRIMFRGTAGGRLTSIIDGNNDFWLWLRGDYQQIEDLTMRNSDPANEILRLQGPAGSRTKTGAVVRGVYFTDIEERAITAWLGQQDVLITNNVIEGNKPQGVDSASGGARGIEVHGNSIEVSYNTISGFNDAIVSSNVDDGNTGSVGVFFHHNEILWGTDDGIELDYTRRNGFAYYNSINNTPSGISFQPCIDGPCFAMRNLVHNYQRGPFKIKSSGQNSYGVQAFHNTVIGGGRSWENAFTTAGRVFVVNNSLTGQSTLLAPPLNTQALKLTTGPLTNLTLNHNAYLEVSKSFSVEATTPSQIGASLTEWQAAGPYGVGSVSSGNPYENITFNWDTVPWTTCRDLLQGSDIEPQTFGALKDAAIDIVYWNVNSGTADIGAVEDGDAFPTVGADWHTADACPP